MKEYFLYDYCLIRTPAFPVERAIRLNNILNEANGNYFSETTQQQLKQLFNDPLFKEAIYIGSKELYNPFLDWLNNEKMPAKKAEKLLRSLHRYYSRMCTRGTPYGFFAGCGWSNITASPTEFQFAEEKIQKSIRFDMQFIIELATKLSAHPDLQGQLKFYVNNSLYKIKNKYIYTEYALLKGKRSYSLSGLTESIYITRVLERAATGATIEQLTEAVGLKDIEKEALINFIKNLIEAQILVCEFLPNVTGEAFIVKLMSRLKELELADEIVKGIEVAYHLLQKKDITISALEEVKKIAHTLVPVPGIEILQANLFYNLRSANINRQVIEEIALNSERLKSIISATTPPDLEEFKRRFANRFEEREVPVTQALDPDAGVGYGLAINGNVENMPLISGVAVRTGAEGTSPDKERALQKLVTKKAKEFLLNKAPVVYVTDEEINEIRDGMPDQPSKTVSAFIFGNIIAGSATDLDKGNYTFMPFQLHTPQCGKLFSRFVYGNEEMRQRWLSSVHDEQVANADALLAEVVYIPEGHEANLTLRPQLRSYEIPYLCQSSVPAENQIPINDLLVSVRNGRVVLRSKRFNKEVFPQITHTHNYRLGQPIYRFLGDIQLQQVLMNFSWPWAPFYDEPFLPRVEYNKIILIRARWLLKKADFDASANKEAFLMEFIEKYTVQRYVLLSVGGDNELLLDLENEFCRQHILHQLKKTNIILFEFLQTPENCFIEDAAGRYATEVVIPLGTRQPFFADNPFKNRQTGAGVITRSFAPGSEWLFIKIYGGSKTLESILVNIIKPMADAVLEQKAIDQWFFIRYNDPDIHLRVRFHRSQHETVWFRLTETLNNELRPFLASEQVSKVVVDTYKREMERYGEQTMLAAEGIFFADSVAVSCLLNETEGEEGERQRWLMGVFGVDRLLNDFGYPLTEKYRLMNSLRESFFKEFSGSGEQSAHMLELSLSNKYRKHSAEIVYVLEKSETDNRYAEVKAPFVARSIQYADHIRAIKSIVSMDAYSGPSLNNLLGSYIHMAMNRLFIGRQRTHELVIYHYLTKYYASAMARQRQLNLPQKVKEQL